MAKYARPKLPDQDPLDRTPRQRFEEATATEGALRPYLDTVKRLAKPVMLFSAECRGNPRHPAFRQVQEVIYRLAWAYHRPLIEVEADLLREGEAQMQAAIARAAAGGWLVPNPS